MPEQRAIWLDALGGGEPRKVELSAAGGGRWEGLPRAGGRLRSEWRGRASRWHSELASGAGWRSKDCPGGF